MKDKNKAIIYLVISGLGFAFMNLFVKLGGDLPTMQKCFFRNFVAMFFALGVMIKERIPIIQPKESRPYILARCIAGSLGMVANFYAIDHLVIADASMLNKMSPFFAIIFSYILIKEVPKRYQIVCVIVAFIGALFILKPGFNGLFTFPTLMGFLGGMGAGLAHTNVRIATSKGADKPFIIMTFSLFTSLLCLPFFIMNFTPMSLEQWIFMIMAGVSATFGQFGITSAFSLARASEISVFDYSIIIFSTTLGFIFLGEVPDIFSFAGYAIIIGAAVAMFILNNKE